MIEARYWAVIPAAGVGRRMGSDIPKQYLPLAGRTVLEWAIEPYLEDTRCQTVTVVIAADDPHWSGLSLKHSKLRVAFGGAERMHSVLAGLVSISPISDDAWVMVHDAARPCLHNHDIDKLLLETMSDSVGGILACPLADTLKLADEDQRIIQTIPRANLWRAQTPQLFRAGLLKKALQSALSSTALVTDEAAAIEAQGYQPKLIEGRTDNIKITVSADITLAARILSARDAAKLPKAQAHD